MRNVSDRKCRQSHKTYFMFNRLFPKNDDVYEIMQKNIVQPDRPQVTIKYGAHALRAG